MVTLISKEIFKEIVMKRSSALDRLIGGGAGQQGTPFETDLKVERKTKDLNIFAKHNDNEACSSLSSVANQVEGEISTQQAIENTLVAMRGQSGILQSMSMSVNDDSLNMLTKAYEQTHNHSINVAGVYHSNQDYKNVINAMANGFIVTAGLENVIANPIKLYFKTVLDNKAMDMNLKAGYEFKGNLPCITAFNNDSVNKVQAFVRTVASQVSTASKGITLFDFINSKGVKFKALNVSNNNILSDKVLLSGMGVKQLAEYLINKFPNNLDEGIRFAKENGVDENRLQRVSMLIKAVRDYTN